MLHSPLLSGVRVFNPNLRWWPSWADIFPNHLLIKKVDVPLLVLHGTADEVCLCMTGLLSPQQELAWAVLVYLHITHTQDCSSFSQNANHHRGWCCLASALPAYSGSSVVESPSPVSCTACQFAHSIVLLQGQHTC